jgi:hypothetical protein
MPDRADITAILLVVAGLVGSLILLVLFPNAFASDTYRPILFFLASIPIYSYAGFWAFSIRHALAVRLYRRQAFGIGFVVLALYSTFAIFDLVPSTASLQVSSGLTNSSFYFLFFVMFYWLDTSVLATRRSDPLLRDTLHWSKIRIPLWTANGITWGTVLFLLGYSEIAGNVSILNQLNTGNINNFVLGIEYNFPIAVLICGVIILPALAVRSKWDRTLQRHFLWFAPTYAGLLFLFFLSSSLPTGFVSSVMTVVVFVAMGYTLYRSAKSLVPLNRISLSPSD